MPFFALAAALPITSALRNVFIQRDPLLTPERPYELAFALLTLSGALVRSPRYHTALSALLLALFAAMMITTGRRPG